MRGPATIPVRATLPWSAEGTWASRPMRSVSGVVCGKGLGGCRMPCVEQLVCYWTVHPQDHTCPSEMPATTQTTTVRTPVYMFFIYFFFLRLSLVTSITPSLSISHPDHAMPVIVVRKYKTQQENQQTRKLHFPLSSLEYKEGL